MRRRVHRKTKKRFKNAMRGFIKDLSRPVLVYKQPVKYECPNCYYDKMTGKSTNECKWTLTEAQQQQAIYEANGGFGIKYKYFVRGRCPVCKGLGCLEVQRKVWIDCKVTWDPSLQGYDNKMVYTPAGHEGATTVELKTDPKYIEIFMDSVKLIIDGVECKMSKAPIQRGLGNETVLKVTAFTTDKLKRNPEELIKSYKSTAPSSTVLGLEDGDIFGLDDGSLLEIT